MTTPVKPWESNTLQNSTQLQRCATTGSPSRSAPVLPPMPRSGPLTTRNYTSYMPYPRGGYNSMSYGGGYGGGYGSYGASSYMPYRSTIGSMYGGGLSSYGGGLSSYGGGIYGNYGMDGYPNSFAGDDAERRFIQYAEESSRSTFANVESMVRAFNSISMMLDNTFFAMTSSFRAVLSVADSFGKLRTMFGHIWYSINIFRLFNWLYRKLMWLMGRKVPKSAVSNAWNQAAGASGAPPGAPEGPNWPTLAFLGVLVSAPYIISKFLPKYEDKCDPANWKSAGVQAKAAFDFEARGPNELSVHINDKVVLAPTYIQEEMNLKNSGWAYATCKSSGRAGVVPLNYLVLNKSSSPSTKIKEEMPVIPRVSNDNTNNNSSSKTPQKRVSFGENQVFENVDLEDYVSGKKEVKGVHVEDNKTKPAAEEVKVTENVESVEVKPAVVEETIPEKLNN